MTAYAAIPRNRSHRASRWLSDKFAFWLAAIVVFVGFLDLANYSQVASAGRLAPKYTYFALAALALGLAASRANDFVAYLRRGFPVWAGAMVLLNTAHWTYHQISGNYEGAAIALTRAQYLLMAAILGFVLTRADNRALSLVFVGLTLTLTGMQLFDFLNPGAFAPPQMVGVVAGRAGSTLINANKAAEALVLTTLLALPALKPSRRIALIACVLPAVVVSFSRTGMLAWGSLLLLTCWFGIVRRSYVLLMVAAAALFISPTNVSQIILNYVDVSAFEDVSSRLTFFTSLDASDASAQERLAVARSALDQFRASPLLGAGAGYTSAWTSAGVSTHNQHLLILSESGLVGYLVFLWLLLRLYRGNVFFGGEPKLARVAVFVVIAFTPFTHNMFDNIYWLLAFALIAHRLPRRPNA